MDAPREQEDFLESLQSIERQRRYLKHQLMQSQKLTIPIGPEAVNALLEGTNPLPSTKARGKFINFICDKTILAMQEDQRAMYEDERQDKTKPDETDTTYKAILGEDKGKGISSKLFLGNRGVKLYQEALEEEAKDPAFRVAAFEASVLKVKNRKFDRKLVGYIGGPSGSGKSVATTAFLEKLPQYVPNKPSDEDSHFVQVDGGIIRKESSMRKLLIRTANLYGYHDISDLHSQSKVLDNVKDAVEAAANVDPDLNLLKPETFSYWSVPFDDTQDDFKKAVADRNVDTVMCKVEGVSDNFSDVVRFMGENRASMKTGFDKMNVQSLDLHDQKDLKESKAYEPMGFHFGKMGSDAAEEAYINGRESQGRPAYSFKVKNDLILLKPKGNHWIPATYSDKDAIMLSQRTYDRWKTLSDPKEPLPSYAEKNRAPISLVSRQPALLHAQKAVAPPIQSEAPIAQEIHEPPLLHPRKTVEPPIQTEAPVALESHEPPLLYPRKTVEPPIQSEAPVALESHEPPLLHPRKTVAPPIQSEAPVAPESHEPPLLHPRKTVAPPPIPVPNIAPEKPSKQVIEPERDSPEQTTQSLKKRLQDIKGTSSEENAAEQSKEEHSIPQIPK